VSCFIRRLGSACGERDELIAHVNEGHPSPSPAAQLELEEASIPGERLLDVADLERNVVDSDEPRHCTRP
jgi:hypothetical protein